MGLLEASDYYVLLEVFIFLAVAQILRSFAKQAGLPEIVADLLAGMLIGTYALGGLVDQFFHIQLFVINSGVLLFADLSVVLLLFGAGLGGGFTTLRRAGIWVVLAATFGDIAAFALAFAAFRFIYPIDAALIIAIAVAPTSTVVAASLLEGERITDAPGAQFLMNAAALDDVVALALLSVALTIVAGHASAAQVATGAVESVVAWIVLLLASVIVLPRLLRVPGLRRAEGLPFALLFGLIAVVLALGFSPIIGAYIAGLAIAESRVGAKTRELTAILVGVFGSLFFLIVGAEFDPHLLGDPAIVGLAVLLAGLGILGKFLGVYPFARRRYPQPGVARAIAVGMIPRGEIGLIVGALGFGLGILSEAMLGEILVMAILTTLIGAIAFRSLAPALRPPAAPGAAPSSA
jgi:Kef-type K+ transport system membrane component KefB